MTLDMKSSVGRLYTQLREAPAIICVDFEATCGNGTSIPRQDMEIIEIGSTILDKECGVWNFTAPVGRFIRPEKNPVLSYFCTQLTGITPEQVERAPTLKEWIKSEAYMEEMIDLPEGTVWCSWGHFDQSIVSRQCFELGIPHMYEGLAYINAKVVDKFLTGAGFGRGLRKAVEDRVGPWEGIQHSGKDDSWNLARVVKSMVEMEIEVTEPVPILV